MRKHKGKLILLAIIIGLIAVVKLTGLDAWLTFDQLKHNKALLFEYVNAHYLLTVLLFIGIYITATALSVPGAIILTLAGGFLFGALPATLYVNIGATVGATLAFIAARYLLGNWVQGRYAEKLEKFNREIDRNGYSYLLSLRFLPVFPFFLINILAGLTKVHVQTFTWTTAVGILPGSLVYAYAGSRLGAIESTSDIVSLPMLLAFVALGLFSLVPTIVSMIRKRLGTGEQNKEQVELSDDVEQRGAVDELS